MIFGRSDNGTVRGRLRCVSAEFASVKGGRRRMNFRLFRDGIAVRATAPRKVSNVWLRSTEVFVRQLHERLLASQEFYEVLGKDR